ncbi:MAG TPA: hypothetical protein VNS29_13525 [Burkholderiaceae bacterium]|nr:hypothetical protein [Burkholderiaceae bacterium]
MKEKAVVRTNKPYRSAPSVFLRLFSVNEDGHETLIATSSPIPKIAAAEICQIFEQPFTIAPSVDSLKAVLKIPGRTAWASATASEAQAAALQACLQHDIRTAMGVLVMVTLSPDCAIVPSLKAVTNVIHREAPSVIERTLVVGFDEGLYGQLWVDVLAVGL